MTRVFGDLGRVKEGEAALPGEALVCQLYYDEGVRGGVRLWDEFSFAQFGIPIRQAPY